MVYKQMTQKKPALQLPQPGCPASSTGQKPFLFLKLLLESNRGRTTVLRASLEHSKEAQGK